MRPVFWWAIVFFKGLVGLGVGTVAAQDGNLQSDLSSSIPKVEIQEAPRAVEIVAVPVVENIPGFTSEEPKSKDELVDDVVGVVRTTQAKIQRARSDSSRALIPEAVPSDRSAAVSPDELSVLIDNLLPSPTAAPEQPRSLQATAPSREDAVLSITEADVKNASKKNLVNVALANSIPIKRTVVHAAQTVTRISKVEKAGPAKTVLKASLPAGETFRSNALRSNINRQEDWVFASGPNVLLVVPVAKDNITASVSTTSRRFARLGASNRDVGNGVVRYTHLVDKPIGGPTSEQGFAFEGTTLVSWDEGFTGRPTSFSGPALTWFLNSVPWGSQKCGTTKPVPCYTVDFETSTSYTWSNIPVLDNAAIGGSVKISRAIPEHNLTLSGKIGLVGNLFPNEHEDRVDGGLTLAASIAWQMRPSTRLSAGVSYGYSRSTISENDWDGYDLLPSVNFSTKLGEW